MEDLKPLNPKLQELCSEFAGLLLRNLNLVTILGKLYYLLYLPIMVTEFKLLNPKPSTLNPKA